MQISLIVDRDDPSFLLKELVPQHIRSVERNRARYLILGSWSYPFRGEKILSEVLK